MDAVLRLKGNPSLEMIHVIKKPGGTLRESFLDEGFILDKKIGVGQPKRVENAKILVRAPRTHLSRNHRSRGPRASSVCMRTRPSLHRKSRRRCAVLR